MHINTSSAEEQLHL